MTKKQTKTGPSKTFDRPVRVMHVVFSLEPGGLENGIVNISNGLDREQFETTIICLERTGAFAERLQDDVNVMCLRKKPKFSVHTLRELRRTIRTIQPDVIHTHNLGPLMYTVMARFLAFSRIGILHGEHAELQGGDLTLKRLVQRRFFYRFVRRVHTVSASLRDQLIDLNLSGKQPQAILNGVDSERFRKGDDNAAMREAAGIPQTAEVIGMVGRFSPTKRHLLMLEAFSLIASHRKTCFLLLLGDVGSAKERILDEIERHSFRDRIIWPGHQNDPAPWYQAMDVLAMPSSNEGLSNAMLEAMSCEIPCIAHPACGASEVIQDGVNGVLKPIDTAEQLANAIEALLENRGQLTQLGKAARDSAVKRFSLHSMVSRYQDLFLRVALKA